MLDLRGHIGGGAVTSVITLVYSHRTTDTHTHTHHSGKSATEHLRVKHQNHNHVLRAKHFKQWAHPVEAITRKTALLLASALQGEDSSTVPCFCHLTLNKKRKKESSKT